MSATKPRGFAEHSWNTTGPDDEKISTRNQSVVR